MPTFVVWLETQPVPNKLRQRAMHVAFKRKDVERRRCTQAGPTEERFINGPRSVQMETVTGLCFEYIVFMKKVGLRFSLRLTNLTEQKNLTGQKLARKC